MGFDTSYDKKSSVWTDENAKGYSYAKWDKLLQTEPDTIGLLRKEDGYRAQTDEYYYYVNYHQKYGWSVAKKRKDFQQPISQQGQQQCSKIDTTERTLAELLLKVERLERKFDNHFSAQQGEAEI
jgi:hypothetical protein